MWTVLLCYAPAPNRRGIKRCFCLTSVCLTSGVCLSVAYIGPKSRTQRPRKTKIGTEVAHTPHVTRTPLSESKGQRSRSPGRFAHRRVGASGGCSGGRENVLAVRNCCYVAVWSAAQSASAPHGGEEGRGHTVAAACLQLVSAYIG